MNRPFPVDASGDGIADGIQTPDTASAVGPSRGVGPVSGIVTDTRFAPLDGAEVTLVLGVGGDAGTRSHTDVSDPPYRVNDGSLPPGGVPAGTPVRVALPSDQIGTGGYQTGWARPVTGDFSGTLSVLP